MLQSRSVDCKRANRFDSKLQPKQSSCPDRNVTASETLKLTQRNQLHMTTLEKTREQRTKGRSLSIHLVSRLPDPTVPSAGLALIGTTEDRRSGGRREGILEADGQVFRNREVVGV